MKKLILFGAGYYGKQAYHILKGEYEITCFVDNNKELWGSSVEGIKIISPNQLEAYLSSNMEIVICTLQFSAIQKQLYKMGFREIRVFLGGHFYPVHEKKPNEVTRCVRCVMDDVSDKTILFDDKGVCNYCTTAFSDVGKVYFPNEEGEKRLEKLLREVRESGRNKKYDCIMGLSGGLDSSYLAYLGYKWGLRVLAVHIDDGYDTEISKSNLQKLIAATKFDYEVVKPDPEQFNDLTLAYMKAGVPNIAIPQDNVLFAFLYKKMREHKIKYFLSGGNFALECILQQGNTYRAFDIVNLMDIHNKFGQRPIDRLEFLSTKQKEDDEKILGIRSPRPLNYIEYHRDRAFKELETFCGFQYYGRKHLENILTAFIQLYWFPKKFGVDKRTSHLSSMIVSGQLTREEALRLMEEPLFDESLMNRYISLIKKNMGLTDEMFDEIMAAKSHQHEEYAIEK